MVNPVFLRNVSGDSHHIMVSEEQAEDKANDHLDVANIKSGFRDMDHSTQNLEFLIVGIPDGIDADVASDSDMILVPR